MGARNVSAAFLLWGHLPALPRLVLVFMALTALDQKGKDGRPPRVYFGGEDELLTVAPRASLYRALATLRTAGAIEVLEKGRAGHRAVYRLRLDTLEAAPQGPVDETQQGPVDETQEGPGNGTHRVPEMGPLGTTKESTKESREGETSRNATTYVPAADVAAKAEMSHEEAHKLLTQRLGIVGAIEAAQAHTDCKCDDVVVCLATSLAAKPAPLRVIPGGAA